MIEAVQAWVGSLVCFFSGVCFKDLSIKNVQIDPVNALIGLAIGAITLRFLWKQNAINEELKSIEARRIWLDYTDRKPDLTIRATDKLEISVQNASVLQIMDALIVPRSDCSQDSVGLTMLDQSSFVDANFLLSKSTPLTVTWLNSFPVFCSVVLLLRNIDTDYYYAYGNDVVAREFNRADGVVKAGTHPIGYLKSKNLDGISTEHFTELSRMISKAYRDKYGPANTESAANAIFQQFSSKYPNAS